MRRINSEVWQSHVLNSTLNDSVMTVYISPQGTPVWRCSHTHSQPHPQKQRGISLPWLCLGREPAFLSDHIVSISEQRHRGWLRFTSGGMWQVSPHSFTWCCINYLQGDFYATCKTVAAEISSKVWQETLSEEEKQPTADTRLGHKLAGLHLGCKRQHLLWHSTLKAMNGMLE